ncbi:hydratase [Subdoligranulum sp. DSM 109015]|uniref:Hydratase n=1 Tax=Gemmiger gallinarum TaxID=2779354 RepID=A0ABR9R4G2_9FIRM|nr:hydratase [Gemmiger gallinarum]MBE5038042.1 hydratase [Gemmiger gallinarum]
MKLHDKGVYLVDGKLCDTAPVSQEEASRGTMAYSILKAHNTSSDMKNLRLKFDSMTSHDITYVGIIQTARASGMDKFPLPYVMTNCHNTLCAVGGTINEDDHQFALSAAHKYGGIYVPPSMAVIHSYNREMMSGCGRMILGSDSHTRYGALGTMAVGEGGGELAKQLVGRTYDMAYPGVVAIYLTGKPNPGVGPQDVALALVGATYANGYVKNKVMEFVGPGVAGLSADFRNGIDVMTTETTCWSSIWETDEVTKEYFEIHGRPEAYKELKPAPVAYYDGCIELDLSTIECMIALPMHPSYAYPIRELKANAKDILHEIETRANEQLSGKVHMDLVSKIAADGTIRVDQGIVAGCSGGTFENVCAVAQILKGKNCGAGEFRISVYPDSMPTYLELVKNGAVADIVSAGGIFRECFCGPCFGAGDTPANGEFSIRHTTRNFPNREGSKPGEGQISAVALMDARSIAATAANGGVLTAASEVLNEQLPTPEYHFDMGVYEKRVYNGWGHPEPKHELKFGPNIKDWPEQPSLSEDLLLKVVSYITDPVTTTDELIPSGETSSFRSNPLRLAEFTLSRKDPGYVGRAKAVKALDEERKAGTVPAEVQAVYDALAKAGVQADTQATNVGSAVFANKPGDGSAREQAASCQRVLGGAANFAREYATKRYRSNCINWGMLPFLVEDPSVFALGDYVFVPGARKALLDAAPEMTAYAVAADGKVTPFTVRLGDMTSDERQILADGCLINYYKNN